MKLILVYIIQESYIYNRTTLLLLYATKGNLIKWEYCQEYKILNIL